MDFLSNIGGGELIFIGVIILLVIGPHRLPEVSRTLGKALRSIRAAYQEFISEFEEELRTVEETTKEVRDGVQTLKETANQVVTPLKVMTEATTEDKATSKLIDALPDRDIAPTEEITRGGPADD